MRPPESFDVDASAVEVVRMDALLNEALAAFLDLTVEHGGANHRPDVVDTMTSEPGTGLRAGQFLRAGQQHRIAPVTTAEVPA